MKKCNKCQKIKESTNFYKLSRNSDGLHSYCKECCQNNSRQYRAENLKKVKEFNKNWYERNKEHAIAKANQWKLNNPEKQKEIWRKSAAKRRKNGTLHKYGVSAKDVLDMWGTTCNICKKPIDLDAPRSCSEPGWEQGLHIDHDVPRAHGGTDTILNLRPTHGLCNIKKKDRMTDNAKF